MTTRFKFTISEENTLWDEKERNSDMLWDTSSLLRVWASMKATISAQVLCISLKFNTSVCNHAIIDLPYKFQQTPSAVHSHSPLCV